MYNWRYVFYINLPFGVLATLGLLAVHARRPRAEPPALRLARLRRAGAGIGALQMMLDRGNDQDWFTSREIIIEAVLAGLGIYLFLVHMAWAPRPLIRPVLFRDMNFSAGLVLMFAVGTLLVVIDRADGAVAADAGQLSGGDRRAADGAARHRQPGRHRAGRPAVDASRSALPGRRSACCCNAGRSGR